MRNVSDYIKKINWGYTDIEIIETNSVSEWFKKTVLLMVSFHKHFDYSLLLKELSFVNILVESRHDEYMTSAQEELDRTGLLTVKYWSCLYGYRRMVQYLILDYLVKHPTELEKTEFRDNYFQADQFVIDEFGYNEFVRECVDSSLIKTKRIEWLYTGLMIDYMTDPKNQRIYKSIGLYLNGIVADTMQIKRYIEFHGYAINIASTKKMETMQADTKGSFDSAVNSLFEKESIQQLKEDKPTDNKTHSTRHRKDV